MMIIGGRAHSIMKEGTDRTNSNSSSSNAATQHGRSAVSARNHPKTQRIGGSVRSLFKRQSKTASSAANPDDNDPNASAGNNLYKQCGRCSAPAIQLDVQRNPALNPDQNQMPSKSWSGSDNDSTLVNNQSEVRLGSMVEDDETSGPMLESAYLEEQSDEKKSRMPHVVKQSLICLLYYFLLAIFCILGALATQAFELPAEEMVRHKEDVRESHIYQYLMSTAGWDRNSTEMRNFTNLFEDYQHAFKHVVKCGYDSDKTLWSFLNSIFYTATIVTTIGYGQLAPKTVGGRIAMIVIAVFGIPLFLMNVAQLSRTFVHLLKAVKKYIRKRSRKQTDETDEEETPQMPFYLAVIIITVYIFLISALLLVTENWDFVEAVYFTFGTLATIGLGDVVPMNVGLLIGFSIFLIMGLSLVTMFLELTEAKMQQCLICVKRKTRVAVKLGIQYRRDRQTSVIEWSKIAEIISQIPGKPFNDSESKSRKSSKTSTGNRPGSPPAVPIAAPAIEPENGVKLIPKEALDSIAERNESID